MAVNSYKEDEQMNNAGKGRIIVRLMGYLLRYLGPVIGVLACMGIAVAIKLVNTLLIEDAIEMGLKTFS